MMSSPQNYTTCPQFQLPPNTTPHMWLNSIPHPAPSVDPPSVLTCCSVHSQHCQLSGALGLLHLLYHRDDQVWAIMLSAIT